MTESERILIISEEITEGTSKYILEQILKINQYDNEQDEKVKDFERKPIKIIINTYGGSIYNGFAIISAIEQSKTPIHTYVYGYAMSMGLLIAVSGHKRFASRMSTYMYHGIVFGVWDKIEGVKQELAESERLQTIYDDYLLSKTKLRQKELDEIKEKKSEWYIPSQEALKLELFDEYI